MYKYKTLQVGQLPQEHLSLLQSLLNFIIIITKYLKQESNDDLCGCMDERSPSGLSTIGDMFYQCHMNKIWHYYPSGEVPYQLLSQSCFYCPDLITVASL